jgi:hypothetical protein
MLGGPARDRRVLQPQSVPVLAGTTQQVAAAFLRKGRPHRPPAETFDERRHRIVEKYFDDKRPKL